MEQMNHSRRQAEIEQWLEMSNPNQTAMTHMHGAQLQSKDDASVISNPFYVEANQTNPNNMKSATRTDKFDD